MKPAAPNSGQDAVMDCTPTTKISDSANATRVRTWSSALMNLRHSVDSRGALTPLPLKASVCFPCCSSQSKWVCEGGIANCASSHAAYPSRTTASIWDGVGPKVAWARKRDAWPGVTVIASLSSNAKTYGTKGAGRASIPSFGREA
ncbi:hypothetical protein D3C71_1276010 [compost metagenome]